MLTKNEVTLIIILNAFISRNKEYLDIPDTCFPTEQKNNLKTACTYADKITKLYGHITVEPSEISRAKNKLIQQHNKLPYGTNVITSKADLEALMFVEVSCIYFDEVLNNMNLKDEVRKNLKRCRQYTDWFLNYIKEEIAS